MAENTLGRLTDTLFAELERLETVDIVHEDAVKLEIGRAKAIQGIAKEINTSAQTVLETVRLRAEWAGSKVSRIPPLLGGK